MHNEITQKTPNGKQVTISLSYTNTITAITITGDFFTHPEHFIELLETHTQGKPISICQQCLLNEFKQLQTQHNAELLGTTLEDIARLIKTTVTP